VTGGAKTGTGAHAATPIRRPAASREARALHCSSGAFSAVMMPDTEAGMSTSQGSRSSSSVLAVVPARWGSLGAAPAGRWVLPCRMTG